MKIESEHLERENEARISAQQEIILLKQQAIDRQVRINFLTAAFGILMAVFAFFIYRNFRLKQNLNRILDEKVKQRACELERNRNELMAALNEREIVIRRISQGITDAVSTLSGLSLTLIQERTPPVPLDFGQKIEKTFKAKTILAFWRGGRGFESLSEYLLIGVRSYPVIRDEGHSGLSERLHIGTARNTKNKTDCTMRTFIAVFCLFALSTSAFTQDLGVVDSLDALLKNRSNSERFAILREMATEYFDKDNQKALVISRMAVEEARKSADSALIIASGRVMGQMLIRLGRIEDAIAVLTPLRAVPKYPREQAAILNSLGISHIFLGEIDEAIGYYFETIVASEKHGDSTYLSIGLKNLGLAYYKLKDYEKALPLLVRSYSLERALDDINHMTPMNISLCYSQLKDYKSARQFLKESIALCGSQCSTLSLIHLRYAVGCIYLGEEKTDSARTAFENSLSFAMEANESRMQLDNIYVLADLHIAEKNFIQAEKLLKQGEDIINNGTPFNIEKIKIYSSLSELYLTLRNFEKAAIYQSRYITLRDSIYDETLTTKLMKAESEYLARENKLKLAIQEERIALKEEVIRKQKALNIAITVLAITAVGFCIVLYRSYRTKKGLNKLLEQKIYERTIALEKSRDSLLRSVNERDLLLKRVTEEFLNTAYTIEGLCYTGGQEGFDPQVTSYFIRIRTALNGVGAYSNSVKADR